MHRALCILMLAAGVFAQTDSNFASPPTFGTTVVASSWFQGKIYYLHHWTKKLPHVEKMKAVGTVYTPVLNVRPQSFKNGFPGITDRYEYFAINYAGRFWITVPGVYRFSLLADDGADLYIDDRLIIDNDGQHEPMQKFGEAELRAGIHSINVPYYQGPRYLVALILKVAPPGSKGFQVFSTEDFKPPPDAKNW